MGILSYQQEFRGNWVPTNEVIAACGGSNGIQSVDTFGVISHSIRCYSKSVIQKYAIFRALSGSGFL